MICKQGDLALITVWLAPGRRHVSWTIAGEMLAVLPPLLCDRTRMTDDSCETLKATIRKLFPPDGVPRGEARSVYGESDYARPDRGRVSAIRGAPGKATDEHLSDSTWGEF
jgi:hypothetical protein